MNAIGVCQLSMVKTLFDIINIIDILAVRLLNTSSCRCEIFSYGQTNHRTVLKLYRALNQTFSERSSAYNIPTVPILNGTGDNFRSRSRVLIYHNNQLTTEKITASIGNISAFRRAVSFGVHNHLIFLQELICYTYGSHQITSSILL